MTLFSLLRIGSSIADMGIKMNARARLSEAFKEASPEIGPLFDTLMSQFELEYSQPQFDLESLTVAADHILAGITIMPFTPIGSINVGSIVTSAVYKETISIQHIYPNVVEFLARTNLWFSVGQLHLVYDDTDSNCYMVYRVAIPHWGLEGELNAIYIRNMLKNLENTTKLFEPGLKALSQGQTADQAIQAIQTSGKRSKVYRPKEKDQRALIGHVSRWFAEKGITYTEVPAAHRQQLIEINIHEDMELYHPRFIITHQSRMAFEYLLKPRVPSDKRLALACFIAFANSRVSLNGGTLHIDLESGTVSYRVGIDYKDTEQNADTRLLNNLVWNQSLGFIQAALLMNLIVEHLEGKTLVKALMSYKEAITEDGEDNGDHWLDQWIRFKSATGQPKDPEEVQLSQRLQGAPISALRPKSFGAVTSPPQQPTQPAPQPQQYNQPQGSRTFGAYRSKNKRT